MPGAVILRQASLAEVEIALPLVERFFSEEGFYAPPEQMRKQLAELLGGEASAVFLAWLEG
jgi:hypothetical protein